MHGTSCEECSAKTGFTGIGFGNGQTRFRLEEGLRWGGGNWRCGRRSGDSQMLKLLGELGHLRRALEPEYARVAQTHFLGIHPVDALGDERLQGIR